MVRGNELIEALTLERAYGYGAGYGYSLGHRLEDTPVGRRLMRLNPREQRDFVLAALEWLGSRHVHDHPSWPVRVAMLALLERRLPLGHDDVIALLGWAALQPHNYYRGTSRVIAAVENYLAEHELTPTLRGEIGRIVERLEAEYSSVAETREEVNKLRELGSLPKPSTPLAGGEAWSDAAIKDMEAMDAAKRSDWIKLLDLCSEASGSKPTGKWSKAAGSLLEKIGPHVFERAVLRWFLLVDKPRVRRIESWSEYEPDPNSMIHPVNSAVLKGLVWLCAGTEDKELARALTALALSTYKKVPQVGPRCVKVGNACVWALGNMPGAQGIGQLALLKVRVKFGTAQKGIEKALNTTAEREGLPREEIEEMSVPTYGLTQVGVRRERLGDFTAELAVTGASTTQLTWTRPDGKAQKSAPKKVREEFADELKELKAAAKDIQKMLPAQRDRVEELYLEQKSWPYPVWRERYLDHPLVGALTRRLIWKFTNGERKAAGVFHEGRILSRSGSVLDWLDEETRVELWHPIGESTGEVLAWRDWLAELEIKQPFKQAHREVYLLTDAERNTRAYSNRYAAHVLKQHQFNALCAARGWKNKLRLMVDDEYPPASRSMPAHGLRAEFWVEGAGDEYGVDTNESATYLYLSTDQVRFYPIESRENSAHAGGGGYGAGFYGWGAPAEPLALEEVPPLVFSEVMRDADLFVGVASVGNDPNWSDGGPEGRYRDYWASYAFGNLTETAKTRKQVLEKLIPRLKIAGNCRLEDRFLVVRGDVRTYRIHLGSGNILMEPNDQYLCIVPSQGGSVSGKVFLPFEGDRTLAIILSKAFLLADDRKIEDPTIRHQIGR